MCNILAFMKNVLTNGILKYFTTLLFLCAQSLKNKCCLHNDCILQHTAFVCAFVHLFSIVVWRWQISKQQSC